MTWKSLIGISPAGIVTFVSDLYPGSISDKQIKKQSGLIDLCEEGDAIMADKGFLISDLSNLLSPPSRKRNVSFLPMKWKQQKTLQTFGYMWRGKWSE